MRARTTSRVLRALIIPIGAIVGMLAAPALLMPSPDDLRPLVKWSTGPVMAPRAFLVSLPVRSTATLFDPLDHKLWRADTERDVDPAA